MKSLLTEHKVINPVTGETFTQKRRTPRVYAPLSFDPGPNPVQQQFKSECDINFIVKNYQIRPPQFSPEQFGDFSDAPSFQEAIQIVATAQQQFMMMPAHVRARFENDPQKFLAFVNDPENSQELIKMGLATKPVPQPTPDPVRVIIDQPDLLDDDSSSPPKRGSKPTK